MLGTVEVETVPMYNVVKNNHPRAMNFVGYVVNVGGVRLYHGGDTERFPEMKTFSADVAMLPLGQTFTMNTVQEAVDAALDVKARIVERPLGSASVPTPVENVWRRSPVLGLRT